jgi:hypothetical protein
MTKSRQYLLEILLFLVVAICGYQIDMAMLTRYSSHEQGALNALVPKIEQKQQMAPELKKTLPKKSFSPKSEDPHLDFHPVVPYASSNDGRDLAPSPVPQCVEAGNTWMEPQCFRVFSSI